MQDMEMKTRMQTTGTNGDECRASASVVNVYGMGK